MVFRLVGKKDCCETVLFVILLKFISVSQFVDSVLATVQEPSAVAEADGFQKAVVGGAVGGASLVEAISRGDFKELIYKPSVVI